jgi:hypothetical protein
MGCLILSLLLPFWPFAGEIATTEHVADGSDALAAGEVAVATWQVAVTALPHSCETCIAVAAMCHATATRSFPCYGGALQGPEPADGAEANPGATGAPCVRVVRASEALHRRQEALVEADRQEKSGAHRVCEA